MILYWIAIFFFCSALLTGGIYRYALARNIIDIPNERSSHRVPTPRGGGISIVLLFTAVSIGLVLQQRIPFSLFYALSAGILIAFVGWLDDVMSIRPFWRAITHLLAATWAMYWLIGKPNLDLSIIIFLFATISTVWCVNLYNFMDGIDGLAGSEGLFISLSSAFVLFWLGVNGIGTLCVSLAATIAGFLVWNWPRAKIFMGDVGSGYLGFIFAVLAAATIKIQALTLSFWITISAVFLCDATFTILYRIYQGKRWYEAHCEHAYQYLVRAGASHKAVTIGVLLLNMFILFPIACGMVYESEWNKVILIVGFLSFVLLWCKIMRFQVS